MTEPTRAEIEREFPDWIAFRGINGLMYAKIPGTAHLVQGEDLRDLLDQLRRYESHRAAQ